MPNIIDKIVKGFKRGPLGSEEHLARADANAAWVNYRAGKGPRPSHAKGPIRMPDWYYDQMAHLSGSSEEVKAQAKKRTIPKIMTAGGNIRRLTISDLD